MLQHANATVVPPKQTIIDSMTTNRSLLSMAFYKRHSADFSAQQRFLRRGRPAGRSVGQVSQLALMARFVLVPWAHEHAPTSYATTYAAGNQPTPSPPAVHGQNVCGALVSLDFYRNLVGSSARLCFHTYLRRTHIEHIVEGKGLIGSEQNLRLTRRDLRAHPAHVD